MHDVFKAAILGIVEGLTEFLPVSSTGHMILTMPLLGIDENAHPWKTFLYFIQIGAILAVVVYFWRRLWRQVLHVPAPAVTAPRKPGGPLFSQRRPRGWRGLWAKIERSGWSRHLLVKLAVAAIPAAVIGLKYNDVVETYLEKPVPVAIALIAGAGIMEWIERRHRRTEAMPIESVSLKQALLIGVAQCLSIVPGTSRAMATIMGGMLVGLPAATAAEFSFYLAIPTLLGAGMLKVVKHHKDLHADDAILLGVGFATAFVVALLVVEGFMRFVQTRRLRPFAIYRVLLGLIVLGWWGLGG